MTGDDRSSIAHLLRRAGFGPTTAEVDAAVARGYTATVDALLDVSGADPADTVAPPTLAPYQPLAAKNLTAAERAALNKQRAGDLLAIQRWWVGRMVASTHPLREKMTWFWHDHFATSYDKVNRADLLLRQNQLFRTAGFGGFEALTQAVAKDPAMLLWLDAGSDKKAHPNENFARELMELFTLGIGNYTEDDVREAARGFTGWYLDPRTGSWAIAPRQHDDGLKTVLGQTGDWGGEDVVHLVVTNPASAPFIVSRVWSHFAWPVTATDPVVGELAPAFAATGDLTALLRAVFLHPAFLSAAARTGLVKQPIEWTVGALRALGLPAATPALAPALTNLGQVPFRPPNVAGWPQNEYWLTTSASLARLSFASAVAGLADLGSISATAPAGRVDAVARLLSVEWSPATAQALTTVAGQVPQLVALALVAPESVLA